jgi:ribosomal protein L29
MKKNDRQKLTVLKIEELEKKLMEERQGLLKLKMEKETGKLKDLHAYAKKRKDIARIRTLIGEKQFVQKKGAK